MNILIITRSPWDNANSLGNTMSNFWVGYPKTQLANLYFRAARPNNDVCLRYFSISDIGLIKGIFLKRERGREFSLEKNETLTVEHPNITRKTEAAFFDYFRKRSSNAVKILQDLFWKLNIWRSKNLNDFLASFKPDIIFSPCFSVVSTYRVLWYCAKKTNAKVVLFHADDYLTNNLMANNAMFSRLHKKWLKTHLTQSAQKADLNYCISPKQKEVYESILNREMKLLYKGADFNSIKKTNIFKQNKPIRIVYIGSTLYGRWQTLALIARAIKEINQDGAFFELDIFSQYQPTKKAAKAMIIEGASEFKGKIPASEVEAEYEKADIVLHVESFDEKEKQKTRLSFSTKIVDCLHSARCLIAIGWEEAASIDYLKQNDAALIANDPAQIKQLLQSIKEQPSLLAEYAQKAWNCGKRNHQIDQIQTRLKNDLEQLLRQ